LSKMKHIVHLSTSHYPNDNRIYYKEVISAARAGYKVDFIVPSAAKYTTEYCKIIGLPKKGGKIRSYVLNQFIGFYKIHKLKPDIVQFHDPELVVSALIMSYLMRRTQFIYDVHEDNYTALRDRGNPQKFPTLKYLLAITVRYFELRLHSQVPLVIAERYYRRVFPKAIDVLNYPTLIEHPVKRMKGVSEYYELIYTGNITPERGLEIYKRLVQINPKIRIHLVGRISSKGAAHLKNELDTEAHRLVIPYQDEFVDPILLHEYYSSQSWTAGLAVFPMSGHYYEKEYMMNSIPVICSNFPTWENIILKHNAGLSVDPDNIEAVSATINRLGTDSEMVTKLGVNGYQALLANYQWMDQEEALLRLYEEILGE